MPLFGRRAIVEVDTLRVEGLDVDFTVAVDDKNFGKGEISIYNLNQEHRAEIEQGEEIPVNLLVGYKDTELAVIFSGEMREAFSTRNGPDWVTTLRTGDGDKAAKARINKSYVKGTPLETLWKDAVDAITATGIGVGNALSKFSEGEFRDGITEILHNGVLQGSALREVRRIAKSANLDVSILDGEIQVTKIGEPLETLAVVLSNRSGLIGAPQKGSKGLLKVRSLIIPGLRPKRKIELESPKASGLYVIKKARYKGNTAAVDWYADLECEEVA